MKEIKSTPSFAPEQEFMGNNALVAGVDEVGYGAWAGPVVVGCIVLDPQTISSSFLGKLQDSKALTAKARQTIYEEMQSLEGESFFSCLGEASPQEVDTHNVLKATHLAIQRALEGLLNKYPTLSIKGMLMDGTHIFKHALPCKALVKGDQKSFSIAAASIYAKVFRDTKMGDLDKEYPYYGWAKNVGYGTALHQEGLKIHGPSPYHRLSYKPIQALLNKA